MLNGDGVVQSKLLLVGMALLGVPGREQGFAVGTRGALFCEVSGDTRFPVCSSGHLLVSSQPWGESKADVLVPKKVSQGADQQEERRGGFPPPRSTFSLCARQWGHRYS